MQKQKNQSRKNTKQQPPKKVLPPKQQKQKRGPRKGPGPQKSVAAAYATGQVGKAPSIVMSRDNCRVVHRELLSSVTGSVGFTTQTTIALNPGLIASFPWLATMAQAWQKYRFHKLRFCYYTRTGSNVPGSCMLVPDYNAADGAPVSEVIASSFDDVAEDAPWKDITCTLAQKRMSGPDHHFVRTGALAANLDIKTYDVGNLFVCTVDGTAVNWGKLWVEYDVEFFIPQLPPAGVLNTNGGAFTGANTQTAANPFGTAPTVHANSLNVAMSNASVLTITNPGDYLLSFDYVGTGITAVTAAALVNATSLLQSSVINSAATGADGMFAIRTTAPNATCAFAVTATTVTTALLYVAEAPGSSLG